MVNHHRAELDATFLALAHPIRRGMLERLRQGEATVGELAEPHDVSAPAITKHLKVLEEAGLVRRERVGREHHLHLRADALLGPSSWLARYSDFWHERLDALDDLLARMDDESEDEERAGARRAGHQEDRP